MRKPQFQPTVNSAYDHVRLIGRPARRAWVRGVPASRYSRLHGSGMFGFDENPVGRAMEWRIGTCTRGAGC
jgi:hypothetical protein